MDCPNIRLSIDFLLLHAVQKCCLRDFRECTTACIRHRSLDVLRTPRPYGPWPALSGYLSVQALVTQRGQVVIRRRGAGRVSRALPP